MIIYIHGRRYRKALTVDQHQDACSCVTLVQEVYLETTAENGNEGVCPSQVQGLPMHGGFKKVGFHSATRRSRVARGGCPTLRKYQTWQLGLSDIQEGL